MKVTVRKVFFKRNRVASPEQGVMIEKETNSYHSYQAADKDVYWYDHSSKYFARLKKFKNTPVDIACTDLMFEINITEEFIRVRCNEDIAVKDMEKPSIIIQKENEESLEILSTKYFFKKGESYFVTTSNAKTITLVDHNLKEIIFDREDTVLKNFSFNLA